MSKRKREPTGGLGQPAAEAPARRGALPLGKQLCRKGNKLAGVCPASGPGNPAPRAQVTNALTREVILSTYDLKASLFKHLDFVVVLCQEKNAWTNFYTLASMQRVAEHETGLSGMAALCKLADQLSAKKALCRQREDARADQLADAARDAVLRAFLVYTPNMSSERRAGRRALLIKLADSVRQEARAEVLRFMNRSREGNRKGHVRIRLDDPVQRARWLDSWVVMFCIAARYFKSENPMRAALEARKLGTLGTRNVREHILPADGDTDFIEEKTYSLLPVAHVMAFVPAPQARADWPNEDWQSRWSPETHLSFGPEFRAVAEVMVRWFYLQRKANENDPRAQWDYSALHLVLGFIAPQWDALALRWHNTRLDGPAKVTPLIDKKYLTLNTVAHKAFLASHGAQSLRVPFGLPFDSEQTLVRAPNFSTAFKVPSDYSWTQRFMRPLEPYPDKRPINTVVASCHLPIGPGGSESSIVALLTQRVPSPWATAPATYNTNEVHLKIPAGTRYDDVSKEVDQRMRAMSDSSWTVANLRGRFHYCVYYDERRLMQ